jgi:ComF family protein
MTHVTAHATARFWRIAGGLRQGLLDLLFPPHCVVCRNADSQWFCPACRAKIVRILPPICSHCGRPLHRTRCPYCNEAPLSITGIRAVGFFEGNLRKAIHVFKYNHRPELAHVLGEILAEYACTNRLPADVIVAVPLHPERERARGYNQAQLLAEELSVRYKIPFAPDALERVRDTRSQVDLDSTERHANVRDAFVASRRVAGTHLLLVDDVCTTGATMDACGIALERAGAASVWGLALARGR